MDNKLNPDFQHLCENVAMLRRRKGVSIRQMSKDSGISIYILSKLEQGIIPPRTVVDVLFQLGTYFNIPAHQLFSELP